VRTVATTEYRVVGQATNRTEGPEKVTGRARYSLDVTLPDALWCKILRSPYPHARIVRIDASRARELPGVHAILTGEDVKGLRTGRVAIKDEPVLAWDRVLFVGDKVAAVAADDEDIAQQALDLIEVDYEPLPAILTAQEAVALGAHVLHPDRASYPGGGGTTPDAPPTNLYVSMPHQKGDIDQGFADADVIVERAYRTPWSHQAYLEPHTALVWVDQESRIQIWSSSQMPSGVHEEFTRLFDLPPETVSVHSSYVGGSFGGKADGTGVPLCYLLAKATGKPVKFVMDYSEELMAMSPRHPSTIRIKAGAKRDGTLTAWEAEAYFASGAYAAYAPGFMGRVMEVAGSYVIPNVSTVAHQTYTNTVPCGFSRAPGEFQGIFAGESHIDAIAHELGIDPFEMRRKNVIHDGDELPDGRKFKAVRLEETLHAAVEAAGYFDPREPNVGRGIGIGHRSQAGGDAHATVTVEADGSISATISIFETGAGSLTVTAQIVAEELGVPADRVEVSSRSTTDQGALLGTGGSRGARVTSIAAAEAGRHTAGTLRRLAAEFFGWAEESIRFEDGHLVDGPSTSRVPIEDIVRRSGAPAVGEGAVTATQSEYTSWSVQIAEVAIDRETGEIDLRKLTTATETGRILNPVGFYGQIQGGIVWAMGEALMEELVVEDGRVTNPSFADMKIPTERDLPELRTVVLESTAGEGPYGVRGIGEHTNIMTAPAIANAIEDASNARVRELPITAEKVRAALAAHPPR
jgi:carbon-monoxide dehydrogenase large subunit